MADDRSKPLYVDPQILARDLGDSLSAAGRATTSPDDESQLREASRRLGIPLDTARANPAETKRAVEQDSFDASDYASRFPSSAKYLADQQNALIAKDDVQPLSEVEKTLRRQVAENMAGGPITDGTSAGRRALPTLTSDREEEQQVLRTEGFAAASRLQRTNASRREAEQYAGSMTATPPSEVRKFFDLLGRGIGSTTDAAVSGLQYSDVGIAGAFQSLFDTIAPVMDPLAGTILPENPLRRVATGLAEYRQQGQASAKARMPKGDTNLSAGYYSGISSLSRNLVALPLALVPGGQGAALSMMTAPVYGQEYGKAKDKGKSTSTAIAYGGTQALIEYATEKLPLSRLIGDIKQGTPFFKLLARQMALEVPGEQLATVLQDLNEWAVLNPEKSFQDYVDARPDAAMQTLVATVVGTGGQVSIISGLQVAADKIAGREARAQREQDRATSGAEQLEQLMAAAAASMTRVRDPQSFSQLVQEAAEDSGTAPTELFIDARRLVEILPQEMLAQLPSVQEQLEEALATDGAVVIPIGEATTTLAGTGFEQELVRNARVTEDAWTAAEAEEGRDLLAQLEQEALQVTEEQTQAQAWEESSKQVFDTLMGELTTAARFAPDVNRAYATLVRNFYTVQAARTGTTPQELYERYPLTVSSRGPGTATENTLEQPPEGAIQAGARVRDDGNDAIVTGGGLTLLHGAPRADLIWDQVQIVRPSGQKQGKKGRVYGGFYTTAQADIDQAQGYAEMAEGTPTIYDVRVKEGTKVLNKEGDVTRLSESYITQLVEQGYGLVVGKDPRGRTEYVVIDKAAVESFTPRGSKQSSQERNQSPSEQQANTLDQEGPSVIPSEKPGAVRVRGVHYSAARRPTLDGRYFGTGLKGAERARIQSLPVDSPLRSRVLAYVDEGSGIRPEQGVGSVAHTVDLDNIYDTGTDPLGIWSNPDANAREQAVIDATFDGYYVPAAMNMGGNKDMGVVALLGEAAYAVPTSPYGGERAQAAPKPQASEMRQALEDFRDHPDLQYGAPSPRVWGVFTKLKAPELYAKLEPTGIFEGEEGIYKSDLIAKAQGQEVFAQSVSLRDGRETLKKYGLDPDKKHKTREVAAALEARQRKKYGTIDRDDRSEEAAKKIAKWMAEEVQFELQNPESSGAGWYSEKFQRALDSFAVEFPELATDQNARDVMTALIAITSDGQKVGPNFAQAADIYGNFRESGKFTTDRGHQRQASIDNNLVVLQDLHDRMGAEGMREYLLQEATVSELRKVAKAQGIDFDTAYQANVKLPMAAVLLGPKLGAFYANLMGASGYLTMDRWWSRTFNRMRGVLIQRPTPQGIARVRELLGQPDLSDDQVLAATVEHRNSYEAKGFKNGTELEKAANTVYKAAFEALEDAPFNATDRTFMLRSVELAQRLLKRRGNDISIADIQAILWYYEKRLYGELGARQSADISYEEAARQVVAQRGNSAGRSDLPGDGQTRPESAGEGVAPGEEIFNAEGEVDASAREAGNGGGRYSSGSLAPLEGAPTVAGAAGPDPRLVSVAEQYARDNGIDLRRQAEFAEVDPERAARIAQAYAEMRHAPNDPKVKEAYDDLIRQTRAQYDALVAAGYQFTLFDEGSDPYGGNPWNAMRDLRANQRMAVYATEAGFGVGAQVNIGLADPQGGGDLTPAQVIEALRAVGAEVEVSHVYSSDTEPTLVVKIKQALTKEQGDQVSEMLGQEAIAQRTDDEQGQLFGPMAEQWGPYNPAYFVTTTGDRADAIANPLLQDTGLQWPNQNGEMRPVLANDLFRAVHDAFGHGLEGAGFRARGEENAWQAHVRLFTGPAVGAITTETRGQNSWLNYGPYGEQNQNAAVEDTVFAEQKTGLMPEWVWAEGRVGDEQDAQDAQDEPVLNQSARFSEDNRLSNLNPSGPSWERIRAANPALAKTSAPDDTVTVYRATVGDSIRPDDFVAVDRAVAEMELENVTDRDGDGARIIEQQVRVRDLLMGNDATEFVYAPEVLNQTGQARATFNPATLDIALLQKADLSSFLHETGHFFFEMQAILASQPDAPQALVDDMQVLLNHVGFTGTAAEWMAQSVSARREAHETVAESFEQYLFTGKAPTAELQPLFHRFRSWMISVYRSLQQFLATNKRASLNPDIAAVFDRMLASEKAINDALAVRQFAPMFGSAADAGMTDEAFAAYQEDIDRQQADALDAVQARTLRDLKWLDNARGRKLKELQKEAAAQRKAVRDEVTAEVNAQPVYRAMEFLKYGRVESDGEQIQVEVTKAAKLNITEIQAMYPEGELGTGADWRSLGYGKYGMLSDAGLHPDTVAEMFEFRSGRQLVTALLEAESKTDLINGLTDQRMLERYGDIASPQAMQEAANEALANEARARLVATELAALTKATGKPGLIARAARQAAEQMVAVKPVRNLRPDLAAASAARARKAAEAAMAKGDTASAAAAKRTEILQIQLERVQRKAQQDHDKALRAFKKIFKGTNEKIAKSRDIGMVNAARGVLARYGLAPKTSAANAQAYAELLANYDGAMSADINSILQGLPLPADFRDLTVEQFRGVRDVVNGLYYLARRSRQVEIDGQKLEIDAVADELVAATTARAGGVVPPLPGYAGTPTERDKWMAGLHSAKAALTRVEFWSDNMGPAFKKYIWNPVAEATTRMRTQRTELIRQYRDLLQGIEKGITYNKIDAPELGAVGFTFNAGKSELLHAILHTGNKSNLTKLLLGRGWGTLDANGALDTQRWDQFVTRMITEGVLTKADFDFAQGVWDLLETVKKDAQAAHKEMYGYYFNEVTADAIDTPFGQYRGGYVPALADSLSSPEMAQKREQEDLLHAGNSFMFPTTGKGFTQSRVFFNRPLELDLRTIGSHLDKVARFAYLEPTVRDVNQLISNKRVARALNGANPGAISDMLTPWLQRTARQSTSMPGKNPKVNRFFNGLRSRTGMVFMFGNVVNTLQQLTGFSLAALRVPAPKLLRATARYMGNPSSMREEVATKSPWLANRMDSQSYAMQDQIDEILTNPGAYEKTVEFAKRHAYFLQQAMQNVMDPIVWSGAYDHALSKGVTEKEAIRYADEAVRTTQGSFAPEDVAGFEVQSPFVRLFTQFYGYFNMWGNLLGNEANKAVREMGFAKSSPRLLFIWFAGVAIPSVVAEIIARGLPDDEDDEDGDGTLDEWLALFFGSQAKSLAATVPGVGHLAVLGANMLDNKVYNDRFNISPALSAAESAVRGGASLLSGELLDEDMKNREVRDMLTLLGLSTGLPVAPVARAAGYATDVNQGRADPEGAADVAAGLLLGR